MTTELLGILHSIECDSENVANVCADKLADYDYSYGANKIVIHEGNIVLKKVFNKTVKNECQIYHKATEWNVEKFFAASMLEINGVYVQEAVDITLDKYINQLPNKIKYGALREDYKQMGLWEMLCRSDCVVLFYLFKTYSLEDILKLQEFCVANDLNDLQLYNAGFKDGVLKFFDYSSCEWEDM